MQLLYPVFPLVALTIGILLRLAQLRFQHVAAGQADPEYYRTYRDGTEPEATHLLSRHYSNLLEQPVLFYAVVALAVATGSDGGAMVPLAWAYVLMRFVHTFLHLGPNVVVRRFQAFLASWGFLTAMWVLLFVRVVSAR